MRETTELSSHRWWPGLVLVVGVCFGVGVAAGFVISPKQEVERATETRAAAPRISAMVGSSKVKADGDVRDVYARLKGASTEDFIREMELLEPDASHSIEMSDKAMALAIRWVLEDAEGAAEFLKRVMDNERYEEFAELFFRVWLEQDREGMMAYGTRLKAAGDSFGESVLGECASAEGETNPEEYLRNLDPADYAQSRYELCEGLRNLAKEDPAKAAAFLAEVEHLEVRRQGAVALAAEWAHKDLAAAREWALGLEDKKERALAYDSIISELAKQDVTAAMAAYEELRAMGADALRSHEHPYLKAHEDILFALGKKDVEQALEWLVSVQVNWGPLGPMDVVARFLPREAVAFHGLLEELAAKGLGLDLRAWFSPDLGSDPATLFSQLSALPEDGITSAMLHKGVEAWMRCDPDATRRAILALPEAQRASAAATALVSGNGFRTAGEAVAFARATGLEALPHNFVNWASEREDAAVAADAILTFKEDPRMATASAFVSQWAARDPERALAWTETIGDVDQRARVAGRLVGGWSGLDSYAASEWVASLAEGPVREAAASGLARAMITPEPSSAFAWALTLRNTEDRARLLKEVVAVWIRNSPEEVMRAVQGADLPRDLHDTLLSKP